MYYDRLGYDSYDDYLNGPEWQEIRDIFYHSGAKYRCRICHVRKSLLVHKRTYYMLRPRFFKSISNKWLHRILVYLCPRCNSLIHFYNKKEKVPLDYLFLWEREKEIYWRGSMIIRRGFRSTISALRWMRYSYRIERMAHRKPL